MSTKERKSRFSSRDSPPRVRHLSDDPAPAKKFKPDDGKMREESEDSVDIKTEKIDLARENPLMKELSEVNKLENFKISPEAIKHLKSLKINYLFPIQAATYNHVLEGKDLIARDKTGSGKTLSYALPLCERFRKKEYFRNKDGQKPLAIVVLPTRELVIQVTNVFNTIKLKDNEFRVLSVYGGIDVRAQMDDAKRGVEIIVGAPGRLLDLLERKAFSLSQLRAIVLDEADLMLDMGFQEDIEKIYGHIKSELEDKEVQSLLFSATIPNWVHNVSKKYLREDIERVDLLKDQEWKTPTTVKHLAVNCPFFSRYGAIGDIVLCYGGKHARTIIFTETKKEANEVMMEAHIKQECQVLHGDIPQKQREITFRAFREGKFKCLIATNVAARGLDIPEVDLIVQLAPPKDVDTYIHRAGRTARAGRTGVCVTFYSKKQIDALEKIEKQTKLKFQRIGAPQPIDIIKATSRDIVTSIRHVPHDVVSLFKDISQELVKDLGAEEALCRAMAIISGTTEKFKQRSLLSSIEGFITYLVESDSEMRYISEAWRFLERRFSRDITSAIKGMRFFKNRKGAVFDVPEQYEEEFNRVIERKEDMRHVVLKKAEQLPELADEANTGAGPGPRGTFRTGTFRTDSRAYSRNDRDRSGSRNKSRREDDSRDDHKKSDHKRDRSRSPKSSHRSNDDMKVFVGGLPYEADESDIKSFFKNEDLRPEEVILLKDSDGKSKGSAFVLFSKPEKAEKATKLSGSKLLHRPVRITMANDKPDRKK